MNDVGGRTAYGVEGALYRVVDVKPTERTTTTDESGLMGGEREWAGIILSMNRGTIASKVSRMRYRNPAD